MLSKQGGKETLGAKTYLNVGMARTQSGFESDRKLVEPYEEIKFQKIISQALMHFKQQLKKFGYEKSLQIIAAN